MNSELWQRPDFRDGPVSEIPASTAAYSEKIENEVYSEVANTEADLDELRSATEHAIVQIQDPLVLLDPVCLEETLLEWLPVLEKVLGPVELQLTLSASHSNTSGPKEDSETQEDPCCNHLKDELQESCDLGGEDDATKRELASDETEKQAKISNGVHVEPVRVVPSKPVLSEMSNLTQLAMLYLEHSCFQKQETKYTLACATFLRRYFFLLDEERVRRMCLLCYIDQPDVQSSFVEAMLELTQSSKVANVIQRGDLLRSLRSLREMQPCSAAALLPHLYRLYEKHGEAAVRSLSQFYPTITPADVMAMADRKHFLAYLDNLVQSRAEDHRLSFLQSLLDPESLRQDWLELALSHDAPQLCDTLTPSGDPRWHSHCFSWGYGRLLSLLIRLPADFLSKQTMAESCRKHGYWMGYVYLCNELQQRSEAFSTICQLDDISLLEEPDGVEPQTLDEWKLLIQMSQQSSLSSEQVPGVNGGSWPNDSGASCRKLSPETLTLMLARTAGPDVALSVLEECGVQLALTPHSELICELLRVTEKRQRAIIQTMLERCDRFLWSQHA